MNPELETINVTISRETEKAFLMKNDEGAEAWFPKSQVSFKRRNVKTGEAVAEIPVWLLDKNDW